MISCKVKSTLKLCKNFSKVLKSWDMATNPYDPCAWNVSADGSQLTIMFNIDNVLLGHAKSSVVTECVKKLDGFCVLIDPLTVTRGKDHEYLGITIDVSISDKACVIT